MIVTVKIKTDVGQQEFTIGNVDYEDVLIFGNENCTEMVVMVVMVVKKESWFTKLRMLWEKHE